MSEETENTALEENGRLGMEEDPLALEADKPTGPQSSLPMLYKAVTPLTQSAHGHLKLNAKGKYEFARNANAILITGGEFAEAASSYPLVFGTKEMQSLPFALTGVKPGQNLFVTEDGGWRQSTYLPAYIRRYPFVLLEDKKLRTVALGIDDECGMFSETEGVALFEDDKPSEALDQVLKLCRGYNLELKKTTILCAEIDKHDLLIDRVADVTQANGEKHTVAGFRIVDEEAFNKLSDEAFLELRKSGALSMIYCHLLSMRSWKNLAH